MSVRRTDGPSWKIDVCSRNKWTLLENYIKVAPGKKEQIFSKTVSVATSEICCGLGLRLETEVQHMKPKKFNFTFLCSRISQNQHVAWPVVCDNICKTLGVME